jgi:hypothetical protein
MKKRERKRMEEEKEVIDQKQLYLQEEDVD